MMQTQPTNDYTFSYCRNDQRKPKQLFHQINRKSLPYQIIKYVLLILNIMIVATTAILTIIVCLLPTIIYEKKLALDNISTFLRTGNLAGNHHQQNIRRLAENEIIQLSAQEIDTIRLIRHVILGLSALIILNQTIAVYGLFKERSYYILISTVIIGLIGQLSLFVLPASIFILITIYLIFSICYVILLNYLNILAKEPQHIIVARSPSRALSIEPQTPRNCCCRCKTCLCNQHANTNNQMDNAVTRKTPIQTQSYQNQVPYYYGSLGRKSRDSRPLLSSLNQSTNKPTNNESIYAQRQPYYHHSRSPGLRSANKILNMNLIDNSQGVPVLRKESIPTNYLAFERSRDTTII